jgi:hypothetical protein
VLRLFGLRGVYTILQARPPRAIREPCFWPEKQVRTGLHHSEVVLISLPPEAKYRDGLCVSQPFTFLALFDDHTTGTERLFLLLPAFTLSLFVVEEMICHKVAVMPVDSSERSMVPR